MRMLFPALVLSGTLALTAAHSAEIYKPAPGETCDTRVKNSAGAKVEGIVVPDNDEYCIGTRRTEPKAPERPHPKLTFEDGYRKTWAEMHGPTFAMTLSNSEMDVVRRALDKTAEEHDKNHDGFDDYWMGRRQRVLEEMNQGGFGLFVGGPGGWEDRQEKTFPLTLLEITLIGIAVSRDRYCRAEDQDIDDLQFLEAGVECYIRNTAAIALFGRIAQARHMTPGGAER